MTAIKLTAADTKLLSLAWQCFETPPKVDLNKLAKLGNYKNNASANSCWYTLKHKLLPQKGKPADSTSITPAELKLFTLAWQCFEGIPKVDVKKLAQLANYKNAASANTCWYNLKKKLLTADDTAGVGTGGKATKRKVSEAANDKSTTSKKKRVKKEPKAAVKEDESLGTKIGTTVEGAGDSGDDLKVVTPQRTPLTDTKALKLEVLRKLEAEAEARQTGKQTGGAIKRETTAEDDEVTKALLDEVTKFAVKSEPTED